MVPTKKPLTMLRRRYIRGYWPSHDIWKRFPTESTSGTIDLDNNQLLNGLFAPIIFLLFLSSLYITRIIEVYVRISLYTACELHIPLSHHEIAWYLPCDPANGNHNIVWPLYFSISLCSFHSTIKSALYPWFLPPMKLTAAGEHRVGLDIKSPWSLGCTK